jgi:DNA-directed RNA polymerase subunit RPC12/RpoP
MDAHVGKTIKWAVLAEPLAFMSKLTCTLYANRTLVYNKAVLSLFTPWSAPVAARTCSTCGSTVRVPDGFSGRSFDCPECSGRIPAPSASERIKRDRPKPRKPSRTFLVVLTVLSVGTALLLLVLWLAARA